jgi:hypothetical protein
MIHVIPAASTRDYHSEVDTISHEAKHFLAKRKHDISQTAFSRVTSEPHVMICQEQSDQADSQDDAIMSP